MIRQEFKTMTEIDLKKLGTLPYCEMNARGVVRPEHDGYIEIIIPIFERDGVRVLKEIELKRKLVETPEELGQLKKTVANEASSKNEVKRLP